MSTSSTPLVADDAVLDGLGERLRQRRHARAMTLADLASATGISSSLLSRLESGLRRPTLDVLLALARVYRLTIDELVGAHATGDPRLRPRPTVRYGMTWLPLGHHPGGLQAHKVILPAGPGTPPEQRSHGGYEWLYVLDGRLRLLLGEHDLVLTPGEVAEFDTHTPHCFRQRRRQTHRTTDAHGATRATSPHTCPAQTQHLTSQRGADARCR